MSVLYFPISLYNSFVVSFLKSFVERDNFFFQFHYSPGDITRAEHKMKKKKAPGIYLSEIKCVLRLTIILLFLTTKYYQFLQPHLYTVMKFPSAPVFSLMIFFNFLVKKQFLRIIFLNILDVC
jgi:hypothetical protein